MKPVPARVLPKAAPSAGPPAPSGPLPRLGRSLQILGTLLLVLDVGSLAILFGRLGLSWYAALGLAASVGGMTSYRAQFRALLSRRAYERRGSAKRYLAVAIVVLALNAGGFYLVATGWPLTYLLTRVLTAAMVLRAWGQGLLTRKNGGSPSAGPCGGSGPGPLTPLDRRTYTAGEHLREFE